MHSHPFWQTAFIAASTLLANAAPTPSDLVSRAYSVEPVQTCSDSVKALNWQTPKPPWMKDATPFGTPFCLSRWDRGARIVGLAAWKEDDNGDCSGKGAINRLEVRFSDGTTVPIGRTQRTPGCDAESIGLDDDEYFAEIVTNVAGDHPSHQGKIHIKTKKKTSNPAIPWLLKQEKWLKDEYNPGAIDYVQKTGAGNLIGFTGYINPDGVISTLEFHFTDSPIARRTRTNVQYNFDFLSKVPIKPNNIAVGTATNWNGDPNNPDLAILAQTVKHSYSAKMEHELTYADKQSFAPKLALEIPIMKEGKISFEAGGTFEWSHETKSVDGTLDTNEESTEFRYIAHVRPGQTVEVVGSWGSASIDKAPFTADSSFVFEDGKVWQFTEHGTTSGSLQLLNNYTAARYRNATETDLQIKGIVRVDQTSTS